MQHRHESELTAAEYVNQKAWRSATPPPCLKGSDCALCGIRRHGTYGRKTPEGMRIQRWWCHQCRRTFSALPDCLASRYRGTLDDLEAEAVQVELQGSVAGAVRVLYPQCINPEAACRRLSRRVKCIDGILRMVCGLVPVLFGVQPTVCALRLHLGTQSVLFMLRSLCCNHLHVISQPSGFRRPGDGSGSQRGPPQSMGVVFCPHHQDNDGLFP